MNKEEIKIYIEALTLFFRNKKRVFLSMVINGILIGVSPYISVILTGRLIDAVYAGEDVRTLVYYALLGTSIIALLMLGRGITNVIFNRNLEYMFEEQNRHLNWKSMQMQYEFLEDMGVHKARQNINSNYQRFGIMGYMLNRVWWLIKDSVTIITAFIIVIPMFFVKGGSQYGVIGSIGMSVGFIVLIILLTFSNYKIMRFYNEKIREVRLGRGKWENRKKYYLNVLSNAENQKDRMIYNQQGIFEEEMDAVMEETKRIMTDELKFQGSLAMFSQMIAVLISSLVYVFSGLRGYIGMITVGSVVTYAASIAKVSDAIYNLVEQMGYFKAEVPYAKDYLDFMKLEKHQEERSTPLKKRSDNKFLVEYEHVSFQYPGSDEYVIKDVNLTFVVGGKMAIVGKNGSGKTTFIKLLCRLYEVTEGVIKVNGIDIRQYNEAEYCELLAVVFQDFAIFDFPIGENIACSLQVEEEKVVDALNKAGLGSRLEILSEGLGTYVGKDFDERGVNFSGGEKQKMAIARAIYKDAPFVIMDEPTAALDPEAEAEVFEGFNKMVGDKTALYISHRLASCRFCEDILVFDKGEVVQRGSHEVLKEQEGLYQQLWNAQAQYYA